MTSATTVMINSILDQTFRDTPSLESVEREVERVFYYNLTKESLETLLGRSNKVFIEQAEIFGTSSKGKYIGTRVRFTKEPEFKPGDGGGPQRYTYTQKISQDIGVKEYNFPISQSDFMSFLADSETHIRKYRVKLPVEGVEPLQYEIDIHLTPNGACSWVKVDVEVDIDQHPELVSATLPKFPFEYTESITNSWNKMTPQEQELKKKIYAMYNLKGNSNEG